MTSIVLLPVLAMPLPGLVISLSLCAAITTHAAPSPPETLPLLLLLLLLSLRCLPTPAAAGAPGAILGQQDALINTAVNAAAVVGAGLLFRSDWQAREKQLVRLAREEKLGALRLELANRRVVSVADLRGAARLVLVAGSAQQVAAALETAQQYR